MNITVLIGELSRSTITPGEQRENKEKHITNAYDGSQFENEMLIPII